MIIGNVVIDGYACLAPMAGVADRAFRELCRQFGASYTVSEMVSSKGISYNSRKSAELMVLGEIEHPCAVQIFGSEPDTMAQAAEFSMQYKPDIIDINMGCPAPKISTNGSGAALMKDPQLCGRIVSAVSNAVDVPVTVKIRKGFDDSMINAVEVACICEQNGASAITVHGRTRQQYYAPPVDWDIIKSVKQAVSVPVIGNGDVKSAEDAQRMYEHTGCDMVMIGRAALGNPWIFKDINRFFGGGSSSDVSVKDRLAVMKQHIERMCDYKGEYIGMKEARKHIAYYLKGFKGAAALRNDACRVNTLADLYALIDRATSLCV